MNQIIQSMAIIAVELELLWLFLSCFLNKRDFVLWKAASGKIVALIACYMAGFLLHDSMVVKQIMIILCMCVLGIWGYQGKWIKILLFTILFQGILLGCDYFVLRLITQLSPNPMEIVWSSPLKSMLLVMTSKMLVFILIMLIKSHWKRNYVLSGLTEKEWMCFFYLSILTFLAFIAMALNFNNITTKEENNTVLFIAIVLVIVNLLTLYLIRNILEREKSIQKNELFQKKMKYENETYHLISENYEKQMKWMHEYKNQIGCIEGVLREQQTEKALNYVTELYGEFKHEIDAINTNNPIINAILNTKYQEAMEKNITMIFRINDLSDIWMEDKDIVTVLSNMLNNAIEACEKLTDNRMIWVKLMQKEEQIIFSVKNTCTDDLEMSGEHFITTKEDADLHGIGIQNIKEVIDRYQGVCSIHTESGYFNFSIMLLKPI